MSTLRSIGRMKRDRLKATRPAPLSKENFERSRRPELGFERDCRTSGPQRRFQRFRKDVATRQRTWGLGNRERPVVIVEHFRRTAVRHQHFCRTGAMDRLDISPMGPRNAESPRRGLWALPRPDPPDGITAKHGHLVDRPGRSGCRGRRQGHGRQAHSRCSTASYRSS